MDGGCAVIDRAAPNGAHQPVFVDISGKRPPSAAGTIVVRGEFGIFHVEPEPKRADFFTKPLCTSDLRYHRNCLISK